MFNQCFISVSKAFQKCIENDSKVFLSLSVLKLFVRIEVIVAVRALGGFVFIQIIYWPHYFFLPQKRFLQPIFFVDPKNDFPNPNSFLDLNFFVPKVFFDPNYFWPEFFWGPNVFRPKVFFDLELFFDPDYCLDAKKICPNFLWISNFFDQFFFGQAQS